MSGAAATTGSPARKGGLPPSGRLAALLKDPRLPTVGTVLERQHGGVTHRITVGADGLHCGGVVYVSPSALAHAITGQVWNGWLWLGLLPKAATEVPAPVIVTPAIPIKRGPGRPIAPRRMV